MEIVGYAELSAHNPPAFAMPFWADCPEGKWGSGVACDPSTCRTSVSFFSDTKGHKENDCSHIVVTKDATSCGDFRLSGGLPTAYVKYQLLAGVGRRGWRRSYVAGLNTLKVRCEYFVSILGVDIYTEGRWYECEFTLQSVTCQNSTPRYCHYDGKFTAVGPSYESEYNKHVGDAITMQAYVGRYRKGRPDKASLSPATARRYYEDRARYHRTPDGVVSQCYRDAMEAFSMDTNNLENLASLVKTLVAVKNGKFFTALGELRKASMLQKAAKLWLSYRYTYATAKADLDEISSKLSSKTFSATRGTMRSAWSGTEGVYRMKVDYTYQPAHPFAALHGALKQCGLAIDAKNLWDLVPFSFVVDWFLPIGKELDDFSSNWAASPSYFAIGSIVSSWKWTDLEIPGVRIRSYHRTVMTNPPEYESYYEDVSTGTVIRRFFDGASLIVGK